MENSLNERPGSVLSFNPYFSLSVDLLAFTAATLNDSESRAINPEPYLF